MTTLAPAAKTIIRQWVGAEPSDSELGDVLAVSVGPYTAALSILRNRFATLLIDPAKTTLGGDVELDASANIDALKDQIKALEPLASREASDAGAAPQSVAVGFVPVYNPQRVTR